MDQKSFEALTPSQGRLLVHLVDGKTDISSLMATGEYPTRSAVYSMAGTMREGGYVSSNGKGVYRIKKKPTPEQLEVLRQRMPREQEGANGELPPALTRIRTKLLNLLDEVAALGDQIVSPYERAALDAMRNAGVRIRSMNNK